MSGTFTVTLKWNYPLNEAVGSDQTELSLKEPITPQGLLTESIQLYPALKQMLEKNNNGEYNVMVINENRLVDVHSPLNDSCRLQVHTTITGG